MMKTHESEPQDELARRMTAGLERVPAFTLPQGFARRVALEAEALPKPEVSSHFGRLTARAACGLLLVAMLALVPWARSAAIVPVTVEMLLVVEFLLLTAWLSLRTPAN